MVPSKMYIPHNAQYVVMSDAPEPQAENAAEPKTPCPSARFTDADSGKWYAQAVDYVASNGVMNGSGEGQFAPNAKLTRTIPNVKERTVKYFTAEIYKKLGVTTCSEALTKAAELGDMR